MIPPTNDTSPVVIQPDKKIIECIKDDRPHQFLNVKTVQTFEPVTFDLHTAYTVYADAEGGTVLASGWTLRDAISLFAHIYNYDRATIRIRRPFKRQ